MRGASVTSASSCGTSRALPFTNAGSVDTSSDAPIPESRASSVSPVSSGSIGVRATAIIAPASSALTTRMMVTPVSRSPSMIARSIGEAPRHRGSSEACTLTMPSRGRASSGLGQQPAVGGDHAEVRLEGAGRVEEVLAREPGRLQHRHARPIPRAP